MFVIIVINDYLTCFILYFLKGSDTRNDENVLWT